MRKGQMSIFGIIYGLIALVLFVGMLPAYYSLIVSAKGNATANGDTFTPIILDFVIPAFALGILLIPVLYSLGGRGRTEEY